MSYLIANGSSGDPGCCATTGQARDLVCPAGTKASFDLQRQFPKLSSQTEIAHQVREHDLPLIIKHDRRHKDGCPREAVETEAISQRCARRHATDPPHRRLRPRTAATARGPNSKTNTLLYVTPCDTRKPPSFAYATVCACSCATASDDFAAASTAGIPRFPHPTDASAWTRRPPRLRPISGVPRRTARLNGFCDVMLKDLKRWVFDWLVEKDGCWRASLRRPDREYADDAFLTRPRRNVEVRYGRH
jgi:hypothetical protein